MEKTLQRLGEVDIIPPPGPSKFVAPQTVMYHLDGSLHHDVQSALLASQHRNGLPISCCESVPRFHQGKGKRLEEHSVTRAKTLLRS